LEGKLGARKTKYGELPLRCFGLLRERFHLVAAVAQHSVRILHGFTIQIVHVLGQQIDDVAKLMQKGHHLRLKRVAAVRADGQKTSAIRVNGAALLKYFEHSPLGSVKSAVCVDRYGGVSSAILCGAGHIGLTPEEERISLWRLENILRAVVIQNKTQGLKSDGGGFILCRKPIRACIISAQDRQDGFACARDLDAWFAERGKLRGNWIGSIVTTRSDVRAWYGARP